MASFCINCGKKLSFLSRFSSESRCDDCHSALESQVHEVEATITATKSVTDQQMEALKRQDKPSILKLYSRLYEHFASDKELERAELETLERIQTALNLTNEDVNFDDNIRPYIYVNNIRKEGKLPSVDLSIKGGGQVILRKGEVVHFADKAALKEMRSVSLGYSGGSHGVSFRIAKGISYRVGAHRGHIMREERLVETSRGALLITNQRLLLHPFPGNRPLSIPLDKILSYQCFNNGIDLYKEGREKGYFFAIEKSGAVELFGICLSYLLKQ